MRQDEVISQLLNYNIHKLPRANRTIVQVGPVEGYETTGSR